MIPNLTMSLLKKRWKRKKSNFKSIFHGSDFLRESDSSIEKALFWTSNFLTAPSSGRSLLNLKTAQERIVKERLNKLKIVLNVGGEKFVMAYKTISLYPSTLLATEEIDKYFDRKRKEYFFDRDPDMFRYVFKFYKNDKIHFPMDECIQALIDEFKFFRIPLDIIKDCCYAEFHLEYENNSNCTKLAKQKRQSTTSGTHNSSIARSPVFVNWLWELLCDSSGRETNVVTHTIVLCIVLNILGMIIETLPCPGRSNTGKSLKCGDLYTMTFLVSDAICVLILTAEFVITLVCASNKKAHFCSVVNILFFVSLLPAYVTWFLFFTIGSNNIPVYVDDACKALRVFRLVKIANYSSKLRETVAEIASAARGLALILVTCIIAILVLSVVICYLDESFSHVPMAMWYFVVTMTSLGYGDLVPSSTLGKVLGTVGVLLGILVVSLPVPIIQNKIGKKLDDEEPETDEIVLDNLYPPDFADRQRRMSRMFSLEHKVLNLKNSVEKLD